MDDSIQLTRDESPILAAIMRANEQAGNMVNAGKFSAAKIALCRAITVAPENFELWSNLSSIMWRLRAYEDARACAARSIQFNNHPDPLSRVSGFLALGNACMSLAEYETAQRSFNMVLEIDPENSDAKWNQSLLSLLLGDYELGWKNYHLRINRDHDDSKLQSKRWAGEKLYGRTIRVLHDQGYGDTIMYSRFLPMLFDLGADEVHFSTAPDLVPLLWDLTELGVQFVHNGAPLPQTDYHVHLGSIPSILGTTRDKIPPPSVKLLSRALKDLEVNDNKTKIEIPQVHPHLKVGICWSGRPDFVRNEDRAVPFKMMASLAESPHIWPYSFQVGAQSQEIKDLGMEGFIQDLSPQLKLGWSLTATALIQMDVVVTCCTSIAHLAASLGVPTWVMLCKEPYWPWGYEGEATPWYTSARLFRQKQWGNWAEVIDQVRVELFNHLTKQQTK